MALRRILTRARQDAPIKMSVFFFAFLLFFRYRQLLLLLLRDLVCRVGQRQFGVDVRRAEEDKSQKAGQEFILFFFWKGNRINKLTTHVEE